MDKQTKRILTLQQYLTIRSRFRRYDFYNDYNVVPETDPDQVKYTALLKTVLANPPATQQAICQTLQISQTESRGIGALLGLGIVDALGASTQFIPFDKNRKNQLIKNGFAEIGKKVQDRELNDRGRVGIWTDDCSMALCIADSLLVNNFEFKPKDLRYRFLLWLNFGLNNGGRPHSIGLGGNISISMEEFEMEQKDYTAKGDRYNNGNGSLMRLAPAAIPYYKDENMAMEVSEKQSWTTHNGDEAAECSRLLAFILVRLINRDSQNNPDPRKYLVEVCNSFVSRMEGVDCLAKSKMESTELFEKHCQMYPKFKKFNKSPELDRNWNWKDPNFTYSKTRNKQQPEYIGSYCMDALSMALFLSYHCQNFGEAALWAVNMGGDCDTVGAIAGQITGAMYGIDKKMLQLYSEMVDAKEQKYFLFVKGYKLVNRKPVTTETPAL